MGESRAARATVSEVFFGKFSGTSQAGGRFLRLAHDDSGVYAVGETFPGVTASPKDWLSKDFLKAGGAIAVVEQENCTGCLTCVRVCPFEVPVIQADVLGVGNVFGAAYIEPAICQGCGICVAECPAKAIDLMHYTEDQLRSKITALVNPKGFQLEFI